MYQSLDNHQGFPTVTTYMQVAAPTPATTRINPEEMRFLRVKVQQVHIDGEPISHTLRTVVVSAAVALNICLKDEAEYFEREYEHQRRTLSHLQLA